LGGFFGFLLGKLTKSPEVFLWAIPIGIFVGYKFANPLWRISKTTFKFLLNFISFKQAK
jgi:hypothetical protein